MEGVLLRNENIEGPSDWRELKERASKEAKVLVENIPGFQVMAPTERIAALTNLLDGLVDNEERFVAIEVARILAGDEEKERHARAMKMLGMVA